MQFIPLLSVILTFLFLILNFPTDVTHSFDETECMPPVDIPLSTHKVTRESRSTHAKGHGLKSVHALFNAPKTAFAIILCSTVVLFEFNCTMMKAIHNQREEGM